MTTRLHIREFVLGVFQTNCYVVWPDGDPRCWIIDCGESPGDLVEFIESLRLVPQQAMLTHAHLDHIAGLHDVRATWPELPILVHEAEADFLTDPMKNLSGVFGWPMTAPPPTHLLHGGDVLRLGALELHVRDTPGHSPGGVTFYQPDNAVAFVGDTLMRDAIGRSDFPYSDGALLARSIRDELLTLPDATTIYPGHGPRTTIERERNENPFITRES